MKKNNKDTGVRESPTTEELTPLINKLYTDFSIEVLEERLETDPLLLSGLFEEITPYCAQCKKSDLDCKGESNCTECNRSSYDNICKCKIVDADIDCFKPA